MLKRGTTTLLSLALLGTALHAQEIPKRTIEVKINGAAKDTVYLANYYGNKLYYADTAIADAKGKVVFRSPRGYKAGVYAIVVPGPKYFEMVVNEPVIQMATEKADLLGKLQVLKSNENDLFIG
ncbi:MAG: DUF4369 domain-containing protein, partial [Flavobacteriales bacterium]